MRRDVFLWSLIAAAGAFTILCCASVGRNGQSSLVAPSPPRSLQGEEGQDPAHLPAVLPRKARLQRPLCLHGCPEARPGSESGILNQLLERETYILSNNPSTKFADWAAYRVTTDTIAKSKRTRWKADPDLPASSTLEPEDYKGANAALGTDRGHQVPLATFSGSEQARSLNYLSNSTPQRAGLNQMIWMKLEAAVRSLVREADVDELFVMTGLLFEREMPSLPGADEEHTLPSGYFKIIAREDEQGVSLAAFIMDQEINGRDSYCEHLVSVDEIEQRSGWDFYVGLDDHIEMKLESRPGRLARRLGCE